MTDEEKQKWHEEVLKSEQSAMHCIRNENLVCKDCLFRMDDSIIFGNTSRCEIYDCKPNEIVAGGPCEDYVKE